MQVFDRLSSSYDLAMLPLELLFLRRLRRRVFSGARGRVLEIGVGTGVNIPRYGPGVDLLALDESRDMLQLAARRPHRARLRLLQADAQAIPLADDSCDGVMGSLVFCSINDPAPALAEIRRVLRPGGQLVLLEHVRGERGALRWLTDRLDPAWHRLSKSCHLNRDTARAVEEAGLYVLRAPRHMPGILQVIVARNP
jgi:ubiquinone/menaquinone biosynthesis C-methylase UbiE